MTTTAAWTKKAWDEACGYHDSEEWLVAAIKKHLRTEEHRQIMFRHDFTIEDMLNGRIEGEAGNIAKWAIFSEWNARLGWKEFGS